MHLKEATSHLSEASAKLLNVSADISPICSKSIAIPRSLKKDWKIEFLTVLPA